MLTILISLLLLSVLALKFPQFTFIAAYSSQYFWLPFQIAYKSSDLGAWVITLQVLCIMIVVVKKFSEIIENHKFEISIFSLFVLLSLLMKNNEVNWISFLLGMKFILAPILISFAYLFGREFQQQVIRVIFILQILNFAAGTIEVYLGLNRLLSLGFKYGTQIRNFESGNLRVPGLAITNFDLGLTSGVTLALAYFILTGRIIFERNFHRIFILIVIAASVGGIAVSYSRTGAVIAATSILLGEALNRKGFLRAQSLFLIGAVASLLLINGSYLFSDNSSFKARLSLWADLPKLTNPLIGQGVGTAGAVTKSSYASGSIPVVVDNYLFSIYLQLGLLGIILFGTYLIYLLYKKSSFSKAIICAIILAMQFVELWEYSLPTSLVLFLHYSFSRHDSSDFLKTRM